MLEKLKKKLNDKIEKMAKNNEKRYAGTQPS